MRLDEGDESVSVTVWEGTGNEGRGTKMGEDEEGVSSSDVAKLIVLDAGWLRSSLAGLQESVLFLRSAGVEEEMLGTVLLLSPRLLCLPSTTMAETMQFLKGLLGEDATTRMLEEEKKHGEGSEGREGDGKQGKKGTQAKEGKEGQELSSGLLQDSAARHVVCQFVTFWPYALFYNWQRNIAPKLHYLQHNMKLPVIELLRFPTFLTLGLNRRIKPRHLALKKNGYVVKPHEEVLGSRSYVGEAGVGAKEFVTGIGKEQKAVCLSQFLPCNDAVFRKRFLQAGEQQRVVSEPAPAAAPLLSN
ncbi:unnamed protein product [Closterium sp. Naga37s-1]|nr:unnamed protein product [Closterium sp. Naga37s-1]